MTQSGNSDGQPTGRRTKVSRLLKEYDLKELGAELERRWTADRDERMSLRALATYFNQQLLTEAMAGAGIQSLSGEVENTYRLLTDDDVNDAERTRAVRRLEREGVDVDALTTDFVTYQAIRSYLQRERGVEYTEQEQDRTAVAAETIQQVRGRFASVTEGKLDQLRGQDGLQLGDFRLLIDVTVLCETCGEQYSIDTLLERGGCDCEQPSGAANSN